MSTIDTKTAILGTEISFPVGIAPTGFHKLAWPDGEMSTARGKRESLPQNYNDSTLNYSGNIKQPFDGLGNCDWFVENLFKTHNKL